MNQARHPVEAPRITRPGGESRQHLGDLGIAVRPRWVVLSGGEPRRRHRRADQAGIAHHERGHPALTAERTGPHQGGHAGVLVAEPACQERARQRRRWDGEPQVGVHKLAFGRRGEVVRRTRIDEQCVPGPRRQRLVGGLQDQLTRFDERPEVAWASQSPAGRQPFVSQRGHFPLHVGPSHRGPARYSRCRSRPQSAYVYSAPHLPPSSRSAWSAGTRPCSVPTSTQPYAIIPVPSVIIPGTMADVAEVEVVVAHNERATLRVGDVFLKIDADQTRADVEVEAMAMAPIPTPEILWRRPPVLALAALPGTALGHLGEPSTASPAAWAAAGAAVRRLHDAALPPWPGRSLDKLASRLAAGCEWLVANDVLPADVVARNRRLAETALRPWTPVFIHGDLQVDHVFVAGDQVTGVVDWSEASQGDALLDLATLTLGHQEHLGDVIAGYGTDVDRDLIRAWWSLRCLTNVRWLTEHGYGSPDEFPEVAVLRSRR